MLQKYLQRNTYHCIVGNIPTLQLNSKMVSGAFQDL